MNQKQSERLKADREAGIIITPPSVECSIHIVLGGAAHLLSRLDIKVLNELCVGGVREIRCGGTLIDFCDRRDESIPANLTTPLSVVRDSLQFLQDQGMASRDNYRWSFTKLGGGVMGEWDMMGYRADMATMKETSKKGEDR